MMNILGWSFLYLAALVGTGGTIIWLSILYDRRKWRRKLEETDRIYGMKRSHDR